MKKKNRKNVNFSLFFFKFFLWSKSPWILVWSSPKFGWKKNTLCRNSRPLRPAAENDGFTWPELNLKYLVQFQVFRFSGPLLDTLLRRMIYFSYLLEIAHYRRVRNSHHQFFTWILNFSRIQFFLRLFPLKAHCNWAHYHTCILSRVSKTWVMRVWRPLVPIEIRFFHRDLTVLLSRGSNIHRV